jgi:hypothetical protein
MLAATKFEGFPWPMIPCLIGFFIGFFVQFRLKYHVDREKVLQLDNMAELYTQGLPSRKILTQRGQRLYFWFYFGLGLFALGMVLSAILYSK